MLSFLHKTIIAKIGKKNYFFQKHKTGFIQGKFSKRGLQHFLGWYEFHKTELLEKYSVLLTFNTGDAKSVDLKETIFNDHRKIFIPLRDIEYFKRFEIQHNTIAWHNKLDLSPEYLYELALKQEKTTSTV